MKRIRGLVPMLVTPFTDDGELDESALRSLVRFQLDCKVDGLAMLGIGGEGYAVTADERDRAVRMVRDEVGGEVPLVVGIAATGDRPGIEQSVRAEQAGADCLMVLPPYLVKPDGDRLIHYFRSVAAAVSIPLMIQDFPDSGVPIAVEVFQRLASIPQITHAKIETVPSAPKIDAVHAQLADELTIIGGRGGRDLLDELAAGASGTMPFCDIADLFREVLDLWDETPVEAGHAFSRVQPLLEYAAGTGAPQAVAKEVLRLRGVLPNSRVRNPTKELDGRIQGGLLRVLGDDETTPLARILKHRSAS